MSYLTMLRTAITNLMTFTCKDIKLIQSELHQYLQTVCPTSPLPQTWWPTSHWTGRWKRSMPCYRQRWCDHCDPLQCPSAPSASRHRFYSEHKTVRGRSCNENIQENIHCPSQLCHCFFGRYLTQEEGRDMVCATVLHIIHLINRDL